MKRMIPGVLAILVSLCCAWPAPAAEAPTVIRIAYPPSGTIISAQVGLTMERTDILKKNGFKPELFAMSNGRDMKLALVGDKADIIMTSEANFVVLLAEGFEAYGVASLGAGGNMGLCVRADSDIRSIDQLRGRTVGTIFGTSLHRPSIDWTRGVPDVHIVSIPTGGALASALQSGKIDAAMLWDPHLTDGVIRGSIRALKEEPLELIAIASKKFVDRNPGALGRFQKAFRESVFYFVTHKHEVNRWYSKTAKIEPGLIDRISRKNRNYNRKRLDRIDIAISPAFIAKMQKTGAFLYKNKVIDRDPDIRAAVRNPKWSR